ncbi:FAD-dependent oxidoreductase [Olsenella sp. AGMB03486]|uniref:FAD-dependent oxidoreductase n=1 Tax=Olsenella sp. AGMB03486 TaxID=3230364 RepID=UPI00349FE14D
MKRYDLIVVGAGPAGMSAAIEAAKHDVSVVVFDENARPGGQLFKQIHKFFGSKEHRAKVRGFVIGQELLDEAAKLGVEVELDSTVIGLYQDKEIVVRQGSEVNHYKGDAIVVATGAAENMVTFEGWTLPGVIGAGAAQTMMNLHGVKPGEHVLMLGTGNVGLVVSYQLKQAGCDVVALVDAAPHVGGYGVHAAKVARTGVPFYLSHTIKRAEGTDHVTGVTIAEVDSHFQFIPGTEKHFDVDTICVAVGLSPMSQLFKMDGCNVVDDRKRGGQVPVVDDLGETSIPGIFAAGDVSGIEEASSAMIEGRIAGLAAASYLGYISEDEMEEGVAANEKALDGLRQGMFAPKNRGKKIEETEEGIPVSKSLLLHGYVADDEIERFPGVTHRVGIHPVIECTQNIPCNPCQDVCPKHCIKVGDHITALPQLEPDASCIGCGLCVASCPGQAIFLVNEETEPGYAEVTFPYEFLPLPAKGQKGMALGRSGEPVCEAEVTGVKRTKAFDHTAIVTVKVPQDMAMKARFFKAADAVAEA